MPPPHLSLGRALVPLRDEGVLIVGSGMSYHNLRDLFSSDPRSTSAAVEFDAWLNEAVTESDPAAREKKLAAWHQAPGARAAHPRPEHLIPLMVALRARQGRTRVGAHTTSHCWESRFRDFSSGELGSSGLLSWADGTSCRHP